MQDLAAACRLILALDALQKTQAQARAGFHQADCTDPSCPSCQNNVLHDPRCKNPATVDGGDGCHGMCLAPLRHRLRYGARQVLNSVRAAFTAAPMPTE